MSVAIPKFPIPFGLALLAITGLASAQTAPALPPFETPPVLDAQRILRPEFLGGPLFSVRREVPTKAGINSYTIDSAFGVFHAEGNTALVQRIAEIQAIARLREISRTDSYKKALADAAKSPLKLAQSAVEHPVDTAGGITKGLWKTVNGIGQSLKEVGQRRPQNTFEDSVPEDLIGLSTAKRRIALSLGVDPYSPNEVLQKDLKSVAWAAYGGKMTFSAALMPIGGTAGLVIRATATGGDTIAAVLDLSPGDLRLRNLKILLSLGVDRALANQFFNCRYLSPTHQTIIVDALAQLRGVPGTDKFLRLAAASDDETDALRYLRSAQLLVLLDRAMPIDRLSAYHGFPLAITRGGALLVPLDWDYACWTREGERFLVALKAGRIGDRPVTSVQIYLTGEASPSARTAAGLNGVALTEKALPGPLK
jgi:hypothetical protein